MVGVSDGEGWLAEGEIWLVGCGFVLWFSLGFVDLYVVSVVGVEIRFFLSFLVVLSTAVGPSVDDFLFKQLIFNKLVLP